MVCILKGNNVVEVIVSRFVDSINVMIVMVMLNCWLFGMIVIGMNEVVKIVVLIIRLCLVFYLMVN